VAGAQGQGRARALEPVSFLVGTLTGDGFGRMFASRGHLTVVVAFNDRSAEKRAGSPR